MARDTSQLVDERAPAHDPRSAAKPAVTVRIAEYALLAAVVAGFIDTLRFAVYFIGQPFAINYQEGNDLIAALRITHGLTPYPPVGKPPYIVNVYGPVYYYALAPLVRLFGTSFTVPRLLIFASGLGVALFLVLLLRHWTKSWVIAFGFGLSFLAVSLVRTWVDVLRVDLFGLALAMAGIYVFTASRRLALPALLFLAALYSKVTLIAAPIACFLYLMWAGERRRAWRFMGWMMGFGLLGLGTLGFATHGWGLFNMFMTHPDPYSFSHYFSIIRPFVYLNLALLAGAVALAIRDTCRRSFSFPLIYFVLASVMTLTAGKTGSDANHLLEWQAAMCLSAGCGYQALRRRWRSETALALIPVGVLVLVSLGLSQTLRLDPALKGCEAAYRFAATQPGQLLTENSGVAVLSGRKVWLSSQFEYLFLGKTGRIDQQPLNRLVAQKFFGVVLIGDQVQAQATTTLLLRRDTGWPPRFLSALSKNYRQVAQFSCAGARFAYEPEGKGSNTPPPKH